MNTASAILPRSSFRSAMAFAKPAVERRNTIPILTHARLRAAKAGGVELVTTDLDVEITARIPDASADESFDVCLPFHMLQDVEKKAMDCAELAIDSPPDAESHARLDFQGLRVSMQALPSNDFPVMELLPADVHAEFTLPTSDLLEMLTFCESCISTEETRYYLNGVLFHAVRDEFRVVATDGHRLGMIARPVPMGCDGMAAVIVPRKTVAILRQLCKAKGAPDTVNVKVNTVKIAFSIGNVVVISKLVDGTYPDYGRVIPTGNDKHVTIDRLELAKAIKAVSALSNERGRAIRLDFDSDSLVLSVTNPDAGRADMRIDCDMGDSAPVTIGFNAAYVLDILGSLDSERVELRLADSGSPCVWRELRTSNQWSEALYVLMPMRI